MSWAAAGVRLLSSGSSPRNGGRTLYEARVQTDLRPTDLVLIGTKRQHRLNPLRLWSDLTTLDSEAADTAGRLHITPVGTLKLGTSIRGDALARGKRAAAVAGFLMYFTRSAIQGMAAP